MLQEISLTYIKTIPNCENTKSDHHMFAAAFFVEYEAKINMNYLKIEIGSGLKSQNFLKNLCWSHFPFSYVCAV